MTYVRGKYGKPVGIVWTEKKKTEFADVVFIGGIVTLAAISTIYTWWKINEGYQN